MTQTITNAITSLIDAFRDRIRNPFILSFAISLIAFNWKPLSFFILSDMEVHERIAYVETTYNSYFWSPFFVALVYVSGLNFFMSLFDLSNKWILNWRKDNVTYHILQDRERKLKITLADLKHEKAKHALQNEENDNRIIENLNNEISEKNLTVNDLNEKISSLNKEYSTQRETYNAFLIEKDDEIKRLHNQEVHLRNELTYSQELVTGHKIGNERLEYDLKELTKTRNRELLKGYEIFRNSTLFEHFKIIGDWIANGRGNIDDNVVSSESMKDNISRYVQSGLIEHTSTPDKRFVFTEKGKIYYDIFKGLVAIKDIDRLVNHQLSKNMSPLTGLADAANKLKIGGGTGTTSWNRPQ